MADTENHATSAESKTAIARRCAGECNIDVSVAYKVLWLDAPISTTAREKAYRWGRDKRIVARKDVVLRPTRVRAPKTQTPKPPSLRPLLNALEKYEAEVVQVQKNARTDEQGPSPAKREFDAIVAKLEDDAS